MKRTIELTPKSTKWIYLFNGAVNTAIGINILLQSESWIHWASILSILLVLAGPLLFVYGIILFYPSNKLTPTINIDQQGLRINRDIFKKVVRIDWTNIKEITFKSFELDFKLDDDNIKTVNLPTTAEKSIEVKKTIRDYCNNKQIKIVGG